MKYIQFTGCSKETWSDRDGAEKILFWIGAAIQFNEDGTVLAWEQRGCIDTLATQEPSFNGEWHEGDEALVYFTLNRLKEPVTVKLGLPKGENAGDYYYYPKSGEASCFYEGEHVGVMCDGVFQLIKANCSTIRKFDLMEENLPSFPQLADKTKLDIYGLWYSFQLCETNEQGKLECLLLRVHGSFGTFEESRVEAWHSDTPLRHDYYRKKKPVLAGRWSDDPDFGHRFNLVSVRPDKQPESALHWQAGDYVAGFYKGKLVVQYYSSELKKFKNAKQYCYELEPVATTKYPIKRADTSPSFIWWLYWKKVIAGKPIVEVPAKVEKPQEKATEAETRTKTDSFFLPDLPDIPDKVGLVIFYILVVSAVVWMMD